jgi:uncharacterized protein with ParB-like and HNH nuclease domain
MAKEQMVSETRGIGQLLNERRYFEVPPHQRDFAWPLGAVEQYLEDIIGAMTQSDADYFLGLIVLVDNTENAFSKRYEILDGQQRLATTTMVYAAIRQWLRDKGMDNEAAKIQNDFIGISEIGEEEDESRIVLNINNRDLFQEIVVNPCADKVLEAKLLNEGRHSSTRKLIEAALFCRKSISDLAEKQGSEKKAQASILFELAKYLRDRVQVNCLDVSAPENAYTIFESLNDRGIDLSVLDLLKNHLLRGAPSNETVILSNWTKMVTTIGDRKGDDFLKAFWTSRFGRIQRGRLFKELKKKYSTKSSITELSKELARVAEIFGSLEISDSDLWKQYSAGTQEQVKTLSLLGAKQTHPILLAAVEKFKTDEVEKLLKHLVMLILRYQLVGRGRTGKLEIQSALISEGIASDRFKSTRAVWERLSTILPSDDEFEDDFSKYVETKPAVARWILRELEIQKWIDENPSRSVQTAPLTDADLVNLEHILPKNPNQEWKHTLSTDKDIVADCLNRLGNLCLLDKPSNKAEAGGGFAKKNAMYAKSEFTLTKEIAQDFQEWNRASIDSRQQQLAKLALKRWSA